MQKLFIILLIPLFIVQCEDQSSETSSILLLEDFEDDSFSADGWSVIEYDVPFEKWKISTEKSLSGLRSIGSATLSSENNLSMLYIYRLPTVGSYGNYRISFYINLECQDSNSDANISTLLQSSNTTPAGEQSIQSRSTVMHQQVGPTSDWEKIEFEFNTNAIGTPPNLLWIFRGRSGESNIASDCRCFIDDFEFARSY